MKSLHVMVLWSIKATKAAQEAHQLNNYELWPWLKFDVKATKNTTKRGFQAFWTWQICAKWKKLFARVAAITFVHLIFFWEMFLWL